MPNRGAGVGGNVKICRHAYTSKSKNKTEKIHIEIRKMVNIPARERDRAGSDFPNYGLRALNVFKIIN